MKNSVELPVNCKQACEILGFARGYMSAIKRAMGLRCRFVFISDVRKFLRTHPDFKTEQIYHRKGCACEPCQQKRQRKLEKLSRQAVMVSAAPVQESEAASPTVGASERRATVKSKQTQRGIDQTTLTFSLDKQLKAVINERARSLQINVSAYFRILAQQDISGIQVLVYKSRPNPNLQ